MTSNTFLTPANYGAAGNGTTNDTKAIQAFLNALANGGLGSWNNASYLVNEGQLIMQPSSTTVNTIGPTILGSATFIASGFANAPILTVQNPTSTGPFAFYLNGDLGNISFVDNNSSGSNRHGLYISGCWGWSGNIQATGLHGSAIYIPSRTGGSPDSYEVYGCDFNLLTKNCINGVYNDNAADGTGIVFQNLTDISSSSDCVFSATGQDDYIFNASFSHSSPTAAAYGLNYAGGSGCGNRAFISGCEFDPCYTACINLVAIQNFQMVNNRLTMRNGVFNAGQTNPTDACIVIGDASNGHVNDNICNGYMSAIIKLVSSGLTLSNVTPAIDFTNSDGINALTFDLTFVDDTGNGILNGLTTTQIGEQFIVNLRSDVLVNITINGSSYISRF
jgi:hypothetical protein